MNDNGIEAREETRERRMTRRTALQCLSGVAAVAATGIANARAAEPPTQRTGMGLVLYDCGIRREWLRAQRADFDLYDPLNFLQHCHQLGAGGMQARLGVMTTEQIRTLREYAERHDLFVDAIVNPPSAAEDVARFESEIRTAADAGVQAARTVIMPGRRYERFRSLEEFREFAARGRRMLERAAPIVEKHRVPLAVENHKDHRNAERVALFEQISSEYVGACVDTGNSFALLEDPVETVRALAPWAKTVHLKDQAVREYEDGFLLGDIPLGQGCLDLKQMVEILKTAQPDIRFALELITRDPLKVPCLTAAYWATFPDVPGSDLARTLRIVRSHPAKMLQEVSSLSLNGRVKLEDANVTASLQYAGQTLRI